MSQVAQSSSRICLRRLLADYRTVLTGIRLRSRNQARVKTSRVNPFLSAGIKTIRETKRPSNEYLDLKLSDADAKLIESNDFVGVKSLDEKGYKRRTPENAFSKITEHLNRNKRVHTEFFMVNILLQLERKDANLRKMILRKPDFYVPTLIQCCGQLMSDLHKNNRQKLLDRLVGALKLNEIPLDLSSINALLTTQLENDTDFDVHEMLSNIDHKWKFQPNTQFFNCLFWQLARMGNLEQFGKLRNDCLQRGVQTGKQFDLAEIYLFECRGITMKSDVLIKRYEMRYGSDDKYKAFGAACCGAVKGQYIDRVRVLLRKSLVKDRETGFNQLKIPNKNLFNVVWMLAENSSDKMGKEWSTLTQQIFESTVRTDGYFKSLYAEAERHINHGYFYSAVTIFQDMYRLRNTLEAQNKTRFVNQIFGCLANKMIVNNVDSNIIIEIGNRMIAFFGMDARFYDNVILAILTYRHFTPMEKFEQFRKFIDLVDPARERIHLILPLIASCSDLTSRCKMLYRCSNLGYKNIADLNPYVVNAKLVQPFVDQAKQSRFTSTDWHCLQGLTDSLKSYGIPLKDIWLLYFNLLKEKRIKGLSLSVTDKTMSEWLIENKENCFPKPDTELEEKKAAMTYQKLKKLVFDERSAEKVHEFLICRGFPPETDFNEITEPLIYLYIETANWGYVQKLLQMLSQCDIKAEELNAPADEKPQQSESSKHSVKNYHLLYILRRKLDELPVDANFSSVIEYVYELKRLFPAAVADRETFFETIKAYRSLFSVLTQSHQEGRVLSVTVVEQIIDLLTSLVRLEIINLHGNETLTPFIIERILKGIGWNAAVETWMKFQTAFHCSNGVLELFRNAIRTNTDPHILFVSHKAKMFIPSPKVDALLAAAYVLSNDNKKGADVLLKSNPPVNSLTAVPVFRLTNALLNNNRRAISSNFPLNFMKICLERTNLAEDEKALQKCHNDWIRICERDVAGVYAIDFMNLFESHGIKLHISNLRWIYSIVKEHNLLVSKWITGPNGVLNLQHVSDSPAMHKIMDYKLKTKQIETEILDDMSNDAEQEQPVEMQNEI